MKKKREVFHTNRSQSKEPSSARSGYCRCDRDGIQAGRKCNTCGRVDPHPKHKPRKHTG